MLSALPFSFFFSPILPFLAEVANELVFGNWFCALPKIKTINNVVIVVPPIMLLILCFVTSYVQHMLIFEVTFNVVYILYLKFYLWWGQGVVFMMRVTNLVRNAVKKIMMIVQLTMMHLKSMYFFFFYSSDPSSQLCWVSSKGHGNTTLSNCCMFWLCSFSIVLLSNRSFLPYILIFSQTIMPQTPHHTTPHSLSIIECLLSISRSVLCWCLVVSFISYFLLYLYCFLARCFVLGEEVGFGIGYVNKMFLLSLPRNLCISLP